MNNKFATYRRSYKSILGGQSRRQSDVYRGLKTGQKRHLQEKIESKQEQGKFQKSEIFKWLQQKQPQLKNDKESAKTDSSAGKRRQNRPRKSIETQETTKYIWRKVKDKKNFFIQDSPSKTKNF